MKIASLLAIASSIALAAGNAAAAAAAAMPPSAGAHAAVFEPLAPNADCHALSTEDKCLAAHCSWCKAGAVPSACYTPDEAAQLPPAVFQCDSKAAPTLSWELTEAPANDEQARALFTAWQRAHNKQYDSALEREMRHEIFVANAQVVAAHNAKRTASFTMELNAFADLSWDEFRKWHLGSPQNCSATTRSNPIVYGRVPDAKDWRDVGAVSPVKNQGMCGSCWTFSTTGCLESQLQIAHGGPMVLLSEQNLLDCADAFDNHGCNGGLPSHAFEYVHYNGGINTEVTYPYTAVAGKCKYNTYHIGAQVASVVNITARDEAQLLAAVGTVGPVSIAFEVVADFRFYKSGVYETDTCKSGEQDVNHAVLAVGYGREVANGKDYWVVKNSWGTDWGMQGFFEIARGSNMCGLADCASYPVVV